MKRILKQFGQILGTQAVLLAATAACAQTAHATAEAGTTETNSISAVVAARKSVFVDDLKSGKDPFFPKSTRRGEKPAPAATTPTVAPVIQLSLKGISGPSNRRFALINNQPLAAGEEAYVRVPGGQVKVHCWEIGTNSVVVSVEGDPQRKVLRLNDSF